MSDVFIPAMGIRIIVFDLDGTLYDDGSHFTFYAGRLAARLPAVATDLFWADYHAALAGNHPLRFGTVYDAQHDLIVVPDPAGEIILSASHWDGRPVQRIELVDMYTEFPQLPETNMNCFLFMGDQWWLPLATALHYGLPRHEGQKAFLETRHFMASDAYVLSPRPGLVTLLESLANRWFQLVLATNSPRSGSVAILSQLGVADTFDDLLFECNKPEDSRELFAGIARRYQVDPAQLLSVGDNYTNEIAPAHRVGARTLFIDAYGYLEKGAWDIRVDTVDKALTVLERLPRAAGGRRH